MSELRWVDVSNPAGQENQFPPREITVEPGEGERVVSVETVRDTFGYAWARVWIERAS